MAEINGKLIAQKILDRVRARVSRLPDRPVIGVVLVGDDPASAKFVARKAKAAEFAGIGLYVHRYPAGIKTAELVAEVERLQLSCDGLVVQLPLPKAVGTQAVLDAVSPDKDIDCLSAQALGRMARGDAAVLPPVAGAIREILAHHKVKLKGKRVVVVGQGRLVGQPAAALFLNEPVTLTVCGLGTKNLAEETRRADILVTGVGKPRLITAGMVKKGAVVIDAGTSVDKAARGKSGELQLVGDVDYRTVAGKCSLITPVPGGVGPLTVALLLENAVNLGNNA